METNSYLGQVTELGSPLHAGWQPSMNFGRTNGWSPIPEEPHI